MVVSIYKLRLNGL